MPVHEILLDATRVDRVTVALPDDIEFWRRIMDDDSDDVGELSGGKHALVLGGANDALAIEGTPAQLEEIALRALLRVRKARLAADQATPPPATSLGQVTAWLHPGSELRSGGELPAGLVGFRLPGDVEITGTVAELAALGDALAERFLSPRSARIQDPVTAAAVVADTRAEFLRALAELRALDAEADRLRDQACRTGEPNGLFAVRGESQDLTREVVRLAEELLGDGSESTDSGRTELAEPDRSRWVRSPADKHMPTNGQQYFTTHIVGRPGAVNSYAFAGGELIEADATNDDGSPNWRDGSLCDPLPAEEAFFYPAVALLRFLNEDVRDLPLWESRDREAAEIALAGYADLGLIAGWRHDALSGGYTVVTHGASDGWTLRTPDMADTFTTAMRSALAFGGEQMPADVGLCGDPAAAAAMWVVISDALTALRDNLANYEVRPWQGREGDPAMPAALTERSGYETLLTTAEAVAADNAAGLVQPAAGDGRAAPSGATDDKAGEPLVVEASETAG